MRDRQYDRALWGQPFGHGVLAKTRQLEANLVLRSWSQLPLILLTRGREERKPLVVE